MFDKSVIRRDDFIEMPDSTQNLYFHLSMDADDDGFVDNWKAIMRMTGKKEDDLKLLIIKQFIIPFDSGVIVIKHWKLNNYLRKDRYTDTKYLNEKKQLNTNDNEEYILKENQLNLDYGIPMVYTDKNSIEEKRIEEKTPPKKKKVVSVSKISKSDIRLAELLVELIVKNTPEWQMRGNIETWADNIEKMHRLDNRSYEQIDSMIRWTQSDPFWKQNILSTAKLREKFNDLIPKFKASIVKQHQEKIINNKPKMV